MDQITGKKKKSPKKSFKQKRAEQRQKETLTELAGNSKN